MLKEYSPFQRAMNGLAHPVSIACILVLLLNDHILKNRWPSWITGKLSDIAWLVFAPLMLVAILSLVLPSRSLKAIDSRLGLISVASIGMVFAVANRLPAFQEPIEETLSLVLGMEISYTPDPSDLLTLPALGIAWKLWRISRPQRMRRPHIGRLWLVVAAFTTGATSIAKPDEGITCLYVEDDKIIAPTLGPVYVSDDGGISWSEEPNDTSSDGSDCSAWLGNLPPEKWEYAFAEDPKLVYIFERGSRILRKLAGSDQSDLDYRIPRLTEAQRHYYHQANTHNSWVLLNDGPLDAVQDQESGNLIVSMGHLGVLVRLPDGAGTTPDVKWQWVAVGPYQLVESTGNHLMTALLGGELWMGFLWALLLISVAIRLGHGKEYGGAMLLPFAMLLWMLSVLQFPPINPTTEGGPGFGNIPNVALWSLLSILTLYLGLRSLLEWFKTRQRVVMILYPLFGTVVYLIPYLLWSQGQIATYRSASNYAVVLSAAVLVIRNWQAPSGTRGQERD